MRFRASTASFSVKNAVTPANMKCLPDLIDGKTNNQNIKETKNKNKIKTDKAIAKGSSNCLKPCQKCWKLIEKLNQPKPGG